MEHYKNMNTPTKRSLDKLRKDGYLVEITEHWNPHAGVRKDLWGFCDLLAIKGAEILAIQVTTQNNMQARINKIRKHKNFIAVKKSGIKIVLHGWGKGKNGKRIIWLCGEVFF